MARIDIKHPFTVPAEQLREQLAEMIDELAHKYSLNYRWDTQDCLSFSRSGSKGQINIEGQQLSFSMSMGLMMSTFKSVIEKDVRKYLVENVA
ncbi:MAG: putative polyhydroxyalkanoate system protein [Oceanicoccus sp.]|jgi:putative polyhydroxyalkanoate system protein